MLNRPRKYFIAKHDLASFLAWPGVIWRTGENDFPSALKKMQVGDRWAAFAYIKNEDARDKTQQVIGFYECTSIPDERDTIPARPRTLSGTNKYAWAIKGKPIGRLLAFPVTVPPINRLLGRKVFSQQTLTPIDGKEFNCLQLKVRALQLDPGRIPLLGRDPRCEQEVVGILIAARTQLGIERIDRIRTRFPDLRVKLVGKRELFTWRSKPTAAAFYRTDIWIS